MIDEKKLIEEIHEYFKRHIDNIYCKDADGATTVILNFNADIHRIVESQPKVGEWIPCSERLPECDYETVLCVTDTNFWAVMVYTGEHGFRSSDLDFAGEVIAWMPLPEPYREEKR